MNPSETTPVIAYSLPMKTLNSYNYPILKPKIPYRYIWKAQIVLFQMQSFLSRNDQIKETAFDTACVLY